ncbi:sensor histidine kinase [Streptomonospora litoralis]|uniref:histidine kinase n=1 Tax=Streptomonospora litoralis TaxID=2498135 RepID=A0A4P6Q3J6_9ACTN|nr:nitrate- and nitrite sensing domain-containing protein [Streptomonospora litoralis]QBI55133.1 sensor protein QseC [Streptomonospora litoralis]
MSTRATDDGGGAAPGGPQADRAAAPAEARPRWWSPREWRVRPRLIALIVIPTAVALVLGGLRISESVVNTVSYDRIEGAAALGEAVVDLATELGRERVMAAAYIADDPNFEERSQDSLETLQEQIQESRQAEQRVQSLIDGLGDPGSQLTATRLQSMQDSLGNLDRVRDEVQNTRLTVLPMVTKYTQILDSLSGFNQTIAEGTSDTELRSSVRALTGVAKAREQLSYEGALMLHSLIRGSMSEGIRSEIEDSRATFENERANFRNSATTDQRQMYEETFVGAEVSQMATTRLRVITRAREDQQISGLTSGDTPQEYQEAAGVVLDRMSQIESNLATSVRSQAATLSAGALSRAVAESILVLIVLVAVFTLTSVVVRSLVRPLRSLREGALRIAEDDLPGAIARMQESSSASGEIDVKPIEVSSRDEIGEVARSFDEVHRVALTLASDEAALRSNVNAMFVNLSRRSQTLVERQLRLIDGLEQGEQDSERLSDLFQLDHLATRMRRNNENLLVLSGQDNTRKWAQPVPLVDVLRGAISEVEEYERINVRAPSHISVLGRPVNDVIHLVAELVENATSFSSNDSQVAVTAQVLDDGGVRVEVTDSGIGMPPEEIRTVNERLAQPPVIDVGVSRRMGLFVVSRLAARHGIRVRLDQAHNGGVTATAAFPPDLLITPVEPQPALESPGAPGAPDTYAEAAAAFAANPAPPEPSIWGERRDTGAQPQLPKREPGLNRAGGAAEEHPPSGEDLWSGSGWNVPPGHSEPSRPEPPAAPPQHHQPQQHPQSAEPPRAEQQSAEPHWDAWDTGRRRHDQQQAQQPSQSQQQRPQEQRPSGPPSQPFARPAEEANPWASQSGPAEHGWANGANGQQPYQSGGSADSNSEPARAEAGRAEWGEPENREGHGSTAYLSRRYGGGGAGQNTVVPPSPEGGSETLPIFDAIESNWFRRRSGGPATEPETGPLPRFGADQGTGAGDGRGRADQPQRGSSDHQRPRYDSAEPASANGYSGRQGGQHMQSPGAHDAPQPQESTDSAAQQPYRTEDDWRSEADRGWQAAQTVAEPMAGGLTTSGLPKRVPKANLVPGTAPTPENVKQVPTRSADRVRNRFSGFQRGVREGRNQVGDMPNEEN